MTECPRRELQEVATITTGSTPPDSHPEYWGNEMPFITPSDQTWGMREAKAVRGLSAAGIEGMRSRIVASGSTNLTCIGSTIGKISFSRVDSVTNQQINSLTPKQDLINGMFLFYACSSISREIKSIAAGSTMPIMNKRSLSRLRIGVPERVVQDAIAEVLGALDDKIEANLSAAKSCLQLCEARLARVMRNPLGESTYGELAEVGGGGTPSTRNESYWGGSVSWATPTDVTRLVSPYLRATERRLTEDGLRASSSPLYPAGSILMTSRATIGAFATSMIPCAVNQGFIVVQPRDPMMKWWLFHEMKTRVPDYVAWANGATFLELPRGRFKSLKVSIPELTLVRTFSAEAEVLHQKAAQLDAEKQMLATLRDTLLPHLMSGRLTVKQAEKKVEEVL